MFGLRAILLSLGLALFAFGSVGCGSKVVKEFEKIKDEMCACADKECAQAVNKRFDEWTKKNQNAKGSSGQRDKAKKLSEEYTACMMKAMSGGAASKDVKKPEPKKDDKKPE